MLLTFGERLAEQRASLGFMQDELCALTSVNRRTQSKYENGKSFPDTRYLSVLMDHGFDVVYLLSGQNAPRQESIDEQFLRDVLVVVDRQLGAHPVKFNPLEKASIAALVFQVSLSSRVIDPTVVDRLIRLTSSGDDPGSPNQSKPAS